MWVFVVPRTLSHASRFPTANTFIAGILASRTTRGQTIAVAIAWEAMLFRAGIALLAIGLLAAQGARCSAASTQPAD